VGRGGTPSPPSSPSRAPRSSAAPPPSAPAACRVAAAVGEARFAHAAFASAGEFDARERVHLDPLANLIRSAATSDASRGVRAEALRAATWLSDGAEGVGFAALFDSSRVGPGAASRILRAIAARIALSRGMADDANRLAWLEDSLEDARTFCETTLRPAAGSAGATAGLAEDVLACLRAAQKAPPKGRNFSETERKTALFATVKLMRVARTNSAAPALESGADVVPGGKRQLPRGRVCVERRRRRLVGRTRERLDGRNLSIRGPARPARR
jgi:hypothetical protein